ncbi:MAG: NAD(P)H-dependent oxidoreductase subunit E [Nitrospinae bacterium]|nr:NAD(P)H-dependent oxidoreductase subunit E [Nitrospinota bacterium]
MVLDTVSGMGMRDNARAELIPGLLRETRGPGGLTRKRVARAAARLGVPDVAAAEAATFYPAFTAPRARWQIRLCKSLSCHLEEGRAVYAALRKAQKWAAAREAPGSARFVIMNADQGEPWTFKDHHLLEHHAGRAIEGLLIACHAVGTGRAYIYLRHDYDNLRRALERELRQAMAAGDGGAPEVSLWTAPGGYICGEESALIASMMGRRAEPRPRPPFPAQAGLHGLPTVINNVETLANVPAIIEHGAEWFRVNFRKLFCVSGDVKRRGVYEAAPGITLRELVFGNAGGIRRAGRKFKMAIVGGLSGQVWGAADLDAPLTHANFGNGAVMVLDESRGAMEVALNAAEFFREECCGACAPCRQGTGTVETLLKEVRTGKKRAKALEQLARVSRVMRDASLCGLGQTATRVLEGLRAKFPAEWGARP